MPKLSWRSQQAKAQRASRKWGFDSGLTDNNSDKNNDSGNELTCEYAFSLGQEKEIMENGDSEEGEDSEEYHSHRKVSMKIMMDLLGQPHVSEWDSGLVGENRSYITKQMNTSDKPSGENQREISKVPLTRELHYILIYMH